MAFTRNIVGLLLAVAGARSVEAFAVRGAARATMRSGVFTGTPVLAAANPISRAELGGSVAALSRARGPRGGCGARMLAGQEFATCSDEDFRNYIVGWTFVWSGIIPYTFIAAKNVLGAVVSAKFLPAVKEGDDATVSNQSILLYKEPIKLLDIINIVGRFQTFDDLQTKKKDSGETNDYLFRDAFKAGLRRRKFKAWPKGPDGKPALSEAFGGDVKAATRTMAERELSESAMNAVFDSFVGSPLSIVADRFKVDNQLDKWRVGDTFNLKGFENGLLLGRLLFLFTVVSVVGLELAGYSVFFIDPIIIRYGSPLAFLGL